MLIVICIDLTLYVSFLFFLKIWLVVSFLQCFELDEETLETREVVAIDIAYDELPEKHYVPEEVSHMLNYSILLIRV